MRHFIVAGVFLMCVYAELGCRKSDQEKAEQKAIEKHEQEVQQQKAAKKNDPNSWRKTPGAPSTEAAAKFLTTLMKSGQLPDTEDAIRRWEGKFHATSTNYPISRTFDLRMKSGQFVNHYVVLKKSDQSPWEIQKSWRTDKSGKTVKVYTNAAATEIVTNIVYTNTATTEVITNGAQ